MEKPKTENPKAPDPLTALPAPEYAELEIQARAQLVTENRSPVSDSLRQGKSHRLVKQRMREMLAAGKDSTLVEYLNASPERA